MRKAKPKKRVILPDPVFNDQKVSKFVNHLMYDGKKNTSYEIFYNALDIVKAKMSNEEKSRRKSRIRASRDRPSLALMPVRVDNGGVALLLPLRWAMRMAARVMTKTAHYV